MESARLVALILKAMGRNGRDQYEGHFELYKVTDMRGITVNIGVSHCITLHLDYHAITQMYIARMSGVRRSQTRFLQNMQQ